MNTEKINQIVETIKTLNLNLDSQSAVEIVGMIKPILWFILFKDMAVSILGLIAFVVAIGLISKGVMNYYKNYYKNRE